ncbi:MAG TPA: helix-turn-helix domain-containing protein [Solirubrobacteraceae bacterium]|nr:helix-turn-helix domain-containing protein [Solirubrobacteraceae bacterium]
MQAYASTAVASRAPIVLTTDSGCTDRKGAVATPATTDAVIDALVTTIVDRLADAVASRLADRRAEPPTEWLDSREAARYLGLSRDTLRKLAAERAIPSEQEGRGCKLFFMRRDLDDWRRAGGRSVRLAAAIAA